MQEKEEGEKQNEEEFNLFLFSEDIDICQCLRGEYIWIWISGMVVAGM